MTTALKDAPTGTTENDGIDYTGDPDTGQLVTLPRVAITIDDTDPTVLKVSFSGSIELERSDPDQTKKFNTLTAGNVADLHVVAYVKSGPTNVHRRDSDGNVDAIVASKSIVITDIRLD